MELKPRYSAGLVIIYNGKILLGHTTGRKSNEGYGIPKGGIEKGESNLEAAIRETYEELGIKVSKKLIDKTQYTFSVTSKKYKTNKVVYYFIVEITDLSQIGLKSEVLPKGGLQLEEINDARFFSYQDAKNVTMYSQHSILNALINKGLLESKTIGNQEVEPNQELNQAQQGTDEDDRLHTIRRFKGKIKDFEQYWNDRISQSGN